MRTRTAAMAALAVAMLLIALPAGAQEPDPYGEVLPGDVSQTPADTVPPDEGAARSEAAADEVTPAAPGALPRTGSGVTVGTLLLGALLLAAGGAAVQVARRRARTPA